MWGGYVIIHQIFERNKIFGLGVVIMIMILCIIFGQIITSLFNNLIKHNYLKFQFTQKKDNFANIN